MPQKPAMWALRATDGNILWNNPDKDPSFGSTTGVPGLVFEGEIAKPHLSIFDSSDGSLVTKIDTKSAPGGLASAAVIADGVLYVGAGVGARGGRPADNGFIASATDSPISAFCVKDTPGCPSGPACSDQNPCTYDFRDGDACASEPGPDGIRCVVGSAVGACVQGECIVE